MDRPSFIGQSLPFLDAIEQAGRAATLDRPVLVIGERGTGKELIAQRLHHLSHRWDRPLVTMNCAALPETLIEAELFGHEAGAFTGAQKRHSGRFERAEGGTLFLDEIASASLRVQEKLLRVIEYGEYERLGGETTLTADVRVVAAANVDLAARAAAGAFRADLLDRLAFDVIVAPPLRARRQDIPLLAAHFASAFARELAARDETVRFEGFAPEAMAAFAAHDWPGNVRELKNAAERSFYRWIAAGNAGPVGEAAIDPFDSDHRPAPALADPPPRPPARAAAPAGPAGPYDFRARLDETERAWAEEALARNGWNQRRTADFLKLSYDQMRGLVRKHGLVEKRAG